MMVSEDAELVGRRGGWMAFRTMDIHIQECSATVCFPNLPSNVKDKILELATSFPALLRTMRNLKRCHVPPTAWPVIFQKSTDGKNRYSASGEKAGSKQASSGREETKEWQRKRQMSS